VNGRLFVTSGHLCFDANSMGKKIQVRFGARAAAAVNVRACAHSTRLSLSLCVQKILPWTDIKALNTTNDEQLLVTIGDEQVRPRVVCVCVARCAVCRT
jgi:hypothetical protein